VALAWHPGTEISADTGSSQAMVDFVVEYHGRTAHAAFDPWNGRSALDGLELTTHALNLLREHVRPSVRIHYAITSGGDVPNVVPENARLWCWVRDVSRTGVEDVMERVHKIVEGAALAADVEAELRIQSGLYEMLTNFTGARILHRNLEALGPIEWSEEEQAFARQLQESAGVKPEGMTMKIEPFEENPDPPEGGSTDVADVSWIVPTIHLSAPTAPLDVPWHAWPVVAAAGSPVGHKGMDYAARALAITTIDLFNDPEARRQMLEEFEKSTAGHTYDPYIPDGPPPIPSP
jgi:aminobenzoyl-glutamate utilization protein B